MPKDRYRVLFVATHPVQYQSPIFRRMAQDPRLHIQVAYCCLQGAEACVDPEFGIEVKWDVPLLEGYPWVEVPNRSPRPGLGRFFGLINPGLWRLVAAENYDAVVVYTGYAYASFWIVNAAAKLRKRPILFGTDATDLQPRNGFHWKSAIKKVLLPRIFGMATVAMAPSAASADYLERLGVPRQRIAVTPFVVDNDYWTDRAAQVDRKSLRAEWGCSDEDCVVLFCAKLQPWKRPHDVLRAFAQTDLPNACLVMAGDGPLRGELEREAKALGVSGRVRFAGFVNQTELPALYCSAEVMVLSSEYDACPVVVCEAMLCGCPVILSDKIRGRAELVRTGETGFFYPCGDVGALAATLRGALSDRDKLKQMGAAARRRMETWSPRENIDAHVQAVQKAAVLAAAGGRP